MKGVMKLVASALAAASVIAGCSGLYTVDQTEQAVVTQFGKPVRVVVNPIRREGDQKSIDVLKDSYVKQGIEVSEGPGLYWKTPFIQSVRAFDRRLLRWDGYPEEIPTVDKKYIWVDTTARWQISDPLTFLTKVGTEEQGQARLDDIIDSTTRNKMTKRDIVSIVRTDNREMRIIEKELSQNANFGSVSEGRPVIVKEIADTVAGTCTQYGIGIYEQGVLIKGLTYVKSVQDSLIQRMISERERIAKRYESEGDGEFRKIMGDKEKELKRIESGAYKTAKEIEGGADAEATKIYAEMLNTNPELYRFLASLDLYKGSLTNGTTMVIGTGSPVFEFLQGFKSETNKVVR